MPSGSTSKLARIAVGAALLVAMLGGPAAAGAPEPPVSDAARAEARALMQQGAREMEDRQYDQAVASFSKAYRLVPSPKVLFNLGIAYLSVARYADALEALEGFLAEATDAPAASQATARRHIADLRAKVVTLEIRSNRPSAELSMDGREYGAFAFDHALTIDPGPHELRGRVGNETAAQTFTAQPGQSMTVTLTFAALPVTTPLVVPAAPAPEAAPPTLVAVAPSRPVYKRPWFWVAVGGGAAIAVAVILTVALSHTDYPSPDAMVNGP